MSLLRLLIIDSDSPSVAERIHAWVSERKIPIVLETADSAASALHSLTVGHYDVIVCSAPMPHIDRVRWIYHIIALAPMAQIILVWATADPAFKSTAPALSRVRMVSKAMASLQLPSILYPLLQQRIALPSLPSKLPHETGRQQAIGE
jgi:DNA-binding NtrC family response regulator